MERLEEIVNNNPHYGERDEEYWEEGATWADAHPSEETIQKIASIAIKWMLTQPPKKEFLDKIYSLDYDCRSLERFDFQDRDLFEYIQEHWTDNKENIPMLDYIKAHFNDKESEGEK